MPQTRQLPLSKSGKEEETEDIGDDEHEEDKAPLSTPREGPRQQWTNGCSNAAGAINNCRDCSKCLTRAPERRMLSQLSRDSSCNQSIWSIDKDASDEGEKDIPVEAGIVRRLAMAGLDWAPISYH